MIFIFLPNPALLVESQETIFIGLRNDSLTYIVKRQNIRRRSWLIFSKTEQ